jgi:hypothetical protein
MVCGTLLSALLIVPLVLGIRSSGRKGEASLARISVQTPLGLSQRSEQVETLPTKESLVPLVDLPAKGTAKEQLPAKSSEGTILPVDLHVQQPAKPSPRTKKIAIVIDDLGWEFEMARRLLRIDAPLTFAILPGLRYSHLVAEEAQKLQREALLHLPMEPYGYPSTDPGNGALFERMHTEELVALVQRNLSLLPQVVGVNNHMGSKLTENARVMETVLQVLKERNLFFVDSMTSGRSVAYQTAKRLGLKSAYRHVFLDNIQQAGAVGQQIRKLTTIAQRNGGAIGIGHPHLGTVQALEEMIPKLKGQGFVIVPVSQLLQ